MQGDGACKAFEARQGGMRGSKAEPLLQANHKLANCRLTEEPFRLTEVLVN